MYSRVCLFSFFFPLLQILSSKFTQFVYDDSFRYYSELRDKERVCVECHCFVNGSTSTTCDSTGKCSCLNNFVGKRCDKCSPGYYKYPECLRKLLKY